MTVNVYIPNWWILPATNEHIEMKKWLVENTDGKWCHWVKENETVVRILGVTVYSEQDAIAFKLKFGC